MESLGLLGMPGWLYGQLVNELFSNFIGFDLNPEPAATAGSKGLLTWHLNSLEKVSVRPASYAGRIEQQLEADAIDRFRA